MTDSRIVFGVNCVWWDSIDKTSRSTEGIPVCPGCGGVLWECPNEKVWFESVDNFDRDSATGYRGLIDWLRGKCYLTMEEAVQAYKNETGIEVIRRDLN